MGSTCDKEADSQPMSSDLAPQAPHPGPEWIDEPSKLLTEDAASLLCRKYLVPPEGKQWEVVYNSDRDGLSVHAFARKAEVTPTPTLLLIADRGGHVFGIYACDGWNKNNRFFGTGNPFIFTVKPELSVYRQTGHNSNFQYFCTGASTLTNGLGMGGSDPVSFLPDTFQVFLDESFREGRCCSGGARATFEAPQLSSSGVFEVAELELIKVRPLNDREKETMGEMDNRSVMLKNKDAVRFMEHTGKTFHTKEMGMSEQELGAESADHEDNQEPS